VPEQLTPQDLLEVVNGNLAALPVLREQPHEWIKACGNALPELTVTRQAVRRVLLALQQGQAPAELVQRWASFVLRGYVAGGSGPIRPIDIEYERDAEDQITTIISRLDELGDLMDGEITDEEIANMLLTVAP
jgi:hypothetical protein